MPDRTLVLGATGTQGGAVARALLGARNEVAALVRDPESDRAQALATAGARLVTGDLLDTGSLARAFADAAAVYAVTTPFAHGAEEELRQGEAIIAAAREAGLRWLIFASVASAGSAPVPHFASKARIEQQLGQSGVPWTVVAPSYFYENALAARASIRNGVLRLALPGDRPLQQVSLADLGALVAALLSRREEHLSARIEVAGDEPTPTAMAAAIGVRFEQAPLQEIRARNPDLAAMYGFLASDGYKIDIAALRARFPEVAWSSFADWARTVDWSDEDAGAGT